MPKPLTTANAEMIESFPAYSDDSQRFELEVWEYCLEVSTDEGTRLKAGDVTRTSDGHVAYPKGEGSYEIPRLGITVLAERVRSA